MPLSLCLKKIQEIYQFGNSILKKTKNIKKILEKYFHFFCPVYELSGIFQCIFWSVCIEKQNNFSEKTCIFYSHVVHLLKILF